MAKVKMVVTPATAVVVEAPLHGHLMTTHAKRGSQILVNKLTLSASVTPVVLLIASSV
jgi:hypothetical protein